MESSNTLPEIDFKIESVEIKAKPRFYTDEHGVKHETRVFRNAQGQRFFINSDPAYEPGPPRPDGAPRHPDCKPIPWYCGMVQTMCGPSVIFKCNNWFPTGSEPPNDWEFRMTGLDFRTGYLYEVCPEHAKRGHFFWLKVKRMPLRLAKKIYKAMRAGRASNYTYRQQARALKTLSM